MFAGIFAQLGLKGIAMILGVIFIIAAVFGVVKFVEHEIDQRVAAAQLAIAKDMAAKVDAASVAEIKRQVDENAKIQAGNAARLSTLEGVQRKGTQDIVTVTGRLHHDLSAATSANATTSSSHATGDFVDLECLLEYASGSGRSCGGADSGAAKAGSAGTGAAKPVTSRVDRRKP